MRTSSTWRAKVVMVRILSWGGKPRARRRERVDCFAAELAGDGEVAGNHQDFGARTDSVTEAWTLVSMVWISSPHPPGNVSSLVYMIL